MAARMARMALMALGIPIRLTARGLAPAMITHMVQAMAQATVAQATPTMATRATHTLLHMAMVARGLMATATHIPPRMATITVTAMPMATAHLQVTDTATHILLRMATTTVTATPTATAPLQVIHMVHMAARHMLHMVLVIARRANKRQQLAVAPRTVQYKSS